MVYRNLVTNQWIITPLDRMIFRTFLVSLAVKTAQKIYEFINKNQNDWNLKSAYKLLSLGQYRLLQRILHVYR